MTTKSLIEQELLKLQGYPKGYLTQEQRLFNVQLAIQNVLKRLEKKVSGDYYTEGYIKWSDVVKAFGEGK